MASQTVENYLKALYKLADESGDVNVSDLSTHLKVSKPTANSMVKKLAKDGMVVYEKYKPLQLTDKGKKAAALIIRKHRLTEMFLVQKMGFGWEEVHEIAEQMEHIKSPAFFNKMDEILEFPNIDPHGSPIPDADGNIVLPEYDLLSDCEVNEALKLVAVTHSSLEFLQFLNTKEIKLGQKMKVKSKEAFDGSMTLLFADGREETLSVIVCQKLMVEKV